jgi:8-oxo-dGTP pyrophosphatase MutT (NUDIX family)
VAQKPDKQLKPYEQYAAELPVKRTSAGALFYDSRGRVLLVDPWYKPDWEIPGGTGEDGEAPWDTAYREVQEELGWTRALGRMLVVDFIPASGEMRDGLAFIFDGGITNEDDLSTIRMNDGEIESFAMTSLIETKDRVSPILHGRICCAMEAIKSGGTALCRAGVRVG